VIVFGLGVMLIHTVALFITFFCRDAMLRVFSPKVFNINLPLTPGFESGFTGFRGLQWTSSLWVQWLFVDDYFSPKVFNLNLPLTPGFESGFPGFRGLQRTSLV
jgi:hypothetical protein